MTKREPLWALPDSARGAWQPRRLFCFPSVLNKSKADEVSRHMGLCLWPTTVLPLQGPPPLAPVSPFPHPPTVTPPTAEAQAPGLCVHTPIPRQPPAPQAPVSLHLGSSAQHTPVCCKPTSQRAHPTLLLQHSVVCPSPSHLSLHSAAGGWGRGVGLSAGGSVKSTGVTQLRRGFPGSCRCAPAEGPTPRR